MQFQFTNSTIVRFFFGCLYRVYRFYATFPTNEYQDIISIRCHTRYSIDSYLSLYSSLSPIRLFRFYDQILLSRTPYLHANARVRAKRWTKRSSEMKDARVLSLAERDR